MASKSFGTEKRPVGKKFRDGLVGDALDDLYSDVDSGFTAAEAGALVTPISFTADAASSASPSTQVATYVVTHEDAGAAVTETLSVTLPFKCRVIRVRVITDEATLNNGANTVDLKVANSSILVGAVDIRNKVAGIEATAIVVPASGVRAKDIVLQVESAQAHATDSSAFTAYIDLMQIA